MRIFMKNSIFDDQKSPLVSSNCCLNPQQKFMVKSREFSTTGRFIAEIPAIFGSPAQLLTSYVVAADAWL